MTAFTYHYLITVALAALVAWTVGVELGRWSARREARRRLHRRQVLAGLLAVDSARGRHPSRPRPEDDLVLVDDEISEVRS